MKYCKFDLILRIDSNERCFKRIVENYNPITKTLKIVFLIYIVNDCRMEIGVNSHAEI